ncbi:hypothetical protein [Williamsia sp. CHRR-6]|uniref:hypothetical protein n=1 Tax=Williamsia sp. CHRR-6 TaxID=2835871 RepID=UPI001BD9EBDE|nr:hypothetical protein [Williamsia sp. CHRR-6]MBT0566191.1 hypothetical protein [Williamsia sp. CHRR-6]
MTSHSGDPVGGLHADDERGRALPLSEPVTRRMAAQRRRPVAPQHPDSIVTDRHRVASPARSVASPEPSTWQRVAPTAPRRPTSRPAPLPVDDDDIAFNLVVPPDLVKRRRVDLSVIIAGIVMMLLGLGVVVGLLML